MSEWIRVEDKLPPVTKDITEDKYEVLTYGLDPLGIGYHTVDCLIEYCGKKRFCGELSFPLRVTHWMDLPKPPEYIDRKLPDGVVDE